MKNTVPSVSSPSMYKYNSESMFRYETTLKRIRNVLKQHQNLLCSGLTVRLLFAVRKRDNHWSDSTLKTNILYRI